MLSTTVLSNREDLKKKAQDMQMNDVILSRDDHLKFPRCHSAGKLAVLTIPFRISNR